MYGGKQKPSSDHFEKKMVNTNVRSLSAHLPNIKTLCMCVNKSASIYQARGGARKSDYVIHERVAIVQNLYRFVNKTQKVLRPITAVCGPTEADVGARTFCSQHPRKSLSPVHVKSNTTVYRSM